MKVSHLSVRNVTAANFLCRDVCMFRNTVSIHIYFVWRHTPIRGYVASLLKSIYHTQYDTHTHTLPVRLLRTSDQHVTEAATYTTYNKHKRRTSMPTAGFEHAMPGIERTQNYSLDCTTTVVGHLIH